MNKERPFESIYPVQNITVGYFEKEEYLKIIDRQEKQIEAFAHQIIALQSRIEILEKGERSESKFTDLEKEVTADAINYLLGAELLEENGYTEEVINALKSALQKLGAEENHL